MKTRFKSVLLFVLLSLWLSSLIKAQTVPCTNSLTCSVKILYRSVNGGCIDCGAGQITIPANTSININLCGTMAELEITVVDIGGTTITSGNVLTISLGFCYPGSFTAISGTNPSNCSNFGSGWSASLTWPGAGFLIQ